MEDVHLWIREPGAGVPRHRVPVGKGGGSLMAALAWPRPGERVAPSGDAGPWAGLTAADLAEVAGLAAPLRRLLVLLGYDVTALYVQPAPGLGWATLDLVTWVAGATAGPEPDGAQLDFEQPTLAVTATPLARADDPSVSMAVALPSGFGWEPDGAAGFLYLTGDATLAGLSDRFLTVMDAFLDAAVAAAADQIEAADPAPGSGSGLLWLLDPAYWWADPVAMESSAHVREMQAAAAEARDAILSELGVAAFLTEQMSLLATSRGGPPLFPLFRGRLGAPTLQHLLRWVPGESMRAPRRADLFFTHLGQWVDERELGAVLTSPMIADLRDAAWFEVLLAAVTAGVLTPPALATEADTSTAPTVAQRIDEHTVEVTVRGQLTITMRRVRDAAGDPVFPAEPAAEEDLSILTPIPEFAWDYLLPTDPVKVPLFVVVAAPGVEVDVPSSPPPVGWAPLVIRVQDRAVVPAWGTAVEPGLLLAPYEIAPYEAAEDAITLPAQPPAAPGVQVVPRPEGISLVYPMYPTGGGEQLVGVDILLGPDVLGSPDARFAWDVTYYQDDRGDPVPDPAAHLSVWITAGVTVEVVTTALTELRDYRLRTEVWQVPDFRDIPPFGAELPFDTGSLEHFAGFAEDWEPTWTRADGLTPRLNYLPAGTQTQRLGYTSWFTTVVDLIVGQIPLVGDVVDIADFISALGSGRDKWGQPVSRFGFILMGFGALMPFVSGSLAKGMGQAIEGITGPIGALPHLPAAPPRLPGGAAPRLPGASAVPPASGVDDLVERALRPVGMKVDDAASLVEQVSAWRSLSQAERRTVARQLKAFVEANAVEFGRTAVGRFLVLEDLVGAGGDSFRIPGLQREFGAWRSRMLRFDPTADVSVDAFVEAATLPRFAGAVRPPPMRTRAMLSALLGAAVVGGSVRQARRAASATQTWVSTADLVFRNSRPAQEWLLQRVRNGDLLAEVHRIVAARTGEELLHGPALWVQQLVVARSEVRRGLAPDYVGRVEQLLTMLAGGGSLADLPLAVMQKLTGPTKSFYTGEFAALLVRALDVVEHDLESAGRTLADVLPLADLRRRIEGVDGFFHGLITAKGYEHGARHEIVMAALQVATAANVYIRMGAKLPGMFTATLREGPDLLRYIGLNPVVADILQGKAYDSMKPLISTVPDPRRWLEKGKPWRGPAIFAQTITDIVRMANTDPAFMLDDLAGTGKVRFTGVFEFSLSRLHYLTSVPRAGSGLSPAYVRKVAGWTVDTIGQRLTADEIIEVIDDLKGVKSAEEIDDLLRMWVLPAVQDQIDAFLKQPRVDLEKALDVSIPADVKLSFEVRFE